MPTPVVTVATLIAKGYPVSTLKSEGLVTLADSDIKDAYFPLTELFTDAKVVTLLHALVYSLLLRRKIVATRYGSVTKVSQYTIAADNDSITAEIRSYCLARLEAYQQLLNNSVEPEVPYFRTRIERFPDYSFERNYNYEIVNGFQFNDILKLYDNIVFV